MNRPDEAAPATAQALTVTVTLLRRTAGPGWQADVQAGAETRHFDSLPDLIVWLSRLEPSPAPVQRGIR